MLLSQFLGLFLLVVLSLAFLDLLESLLELSHTLLLLCQLARPYLASEIIGKLCFLGRLNESRLPRVLFISIFLGETIHALGSVAFSGRVRRAGSHVLIESS